MANQIKTPDHNSQTTHLSTHCKDNKSSAGPKSGNTLTLEQQSLIGSQNRNQKQSKSKGKCSNAQKCKQPVVVNENSKRQMPNTHKVKRFHAKTVGIIVGGFIVGGRL